MPLFNPKTLDAALKASAFAPNEQQQAAATRWAALLRDQYSLSLKETSLEADFNRYVVQDILGYRSFDSSGTASLSVKQRIGSGEADLALGQFSPGRADVLAPFELKGPSCKNLDAIMPGRAKTPVQQAWEYANDAIGARWVIVSNQVEVRLYAVGRGRRDYEVFDLRQLDKPETLKRFVLLLSAQQLLTGATQRLLDRSLVEDKDITEKLYRDYRTLRDNLLQFVRSQHQEILPENAIRLAQTILDRVIFIAFAEDTVLLPDDSLKNAVKFENPYGDPEPKWKNVKRLFEAIDKGSSRLTIPPYNGGLFAADPMIDALDIPDHLCEQFANISSYDFKSQISVTILGHIFEQSITDLELLQAEMRGEQKPKTSKRKRDGVVYTPDFVTRFIVEHTIGTHLKECFERLLGEHTNGKDATGNIRWRERNSELAFWRAYLEAVTGLRIVDPACGSGAFLIAAFDFLKAEQNRVRERLTELEPGLLTHADADADIEIITRNLYGVDVNAESVEITKLSLWLKTAKRGRQLESLDRTICWGNSLVEDSDFHIRAFEWKKAFPDIFARGGFDIVLGNPPYVRMELIKRFKPYLEKRYEVVADRADLYAYFFELGTRLLKPGGRLGYISSSTFFRTGSGEALRRYLSEKSEIETVVDFGELQIFEGVTTYPAIITLRRINGRSPDADLCFLNVETLPDDLSKAFGLGAQPMPRARLGTGSWRLESDRLDAIRKKMAAGRKTLAEIYGPPLYGIKTGLNEAFILNRARRDALIARDPRSAELLKPFLIGENLKRWHIESDDLWLIYTPKKRVDIEQYPAIRDHLAPFRDQLEERATKQEWWELQQAQAAYETHFLNNTVIWRDISRGPTFSFLSNPHYLDCTNFFWPSAISSLASYLGSKSFWFQLAGLTPIASGGYYRLKGQYFDFIPSLRDDQIQSLFEPGRDIQTSCEQRYAWHCAFLRRLADVAPGALQTPALKNWADFNFSELRVLLKKHLKADIAVSERDQWEAYFNARKSEVVTLSARIADLESEINDRVYRLFDLSRDEIAAIEESIAEKY